MKKPVPLLLMDCHVVAPGHLSGTTLTHQLRPFDVTQWPECGKGTL